MCFPDPKADFSGSGKTKLAFQFKKLEKNLAFQTSDLLLKQIFLVLRKHSPETLQ
jgi:hypothetical protein